MLAYAPNTGNIGKKFEIWCANKSVLQVLDSTRKPSIVELSNSEGKLVQQTRRLLSHFLGASLIHVKDHQDDDTRHEDLDYQSRLTVDCNREAKKVMRASIAPKGRNPKDGHPVTLYMSNMEVTTKCDEQTQYALCTCKAHVYLHTCLKGMHG